MGNGVDLAIKPLLPFHNRKCKVVMYGGKTYIGTLFIKGHSVWIMPRGKQERLRPSNIFNVIPQ